MHPAVFLDRDGVLIESSPNYVRSWEQAEIYPGAFEALAKAGQNKDLKFVIVTNQSGVGRGVIDIAAADEINRMLVIEAQKAGGRIDAVCMCIHSPQQQCDCRKPKPGLIHDGARLLKIDLERSIMIGDALTDIEAGEAAGVPVNALVLTGRGEEQLKKNGSVPHVFANVQEALDQLL